MPVISCIGATEDGVPLNINADTVASEIALAIKADSLLLVTDTPGIRIEGSVQSNRITKKKLYSGLRRVKFTGECCRKLKLRSIV